MFSGIMKFYIALFITAISSLSVLNATLIPSETFDLHSIQHNDTSPNTSAVRRAADYLLRKRQTGNDWNSLSLRIVVALAFAERAGAIPKQWLSVLEKEVGIHIKANIMKRNASPDLCELAYYINALRATCQNPRHFHGIDLVSLLRKEANAAGKLDMPIVFLTLCLAEEIDPWDLSKLMEMNFKVRDDTLGSKALIVMAMACISNATGIHPAIKKELRDFMRSTHQNLQYFDIYTKLLHVQALNALNYKTNVDLATHQLPDGSFGDALATYYAIPALLGTSLLDLKCKTSNSAEFAVQIGSGIQGSKMNVVYSLWIKKNTVVDAHSLSISLEGNKTFYDLMRIAESKNPFYSFLYDNTVDGKKVFSLGGIPNDVEMEKVWTLYRGREDKVKFNSRNSLAKQDFGVDKIFPTAGDHFVFWYEQSSS